jgi:nucleoid-associated protein
MTLRAPRIHSFHARMSLSEQSITHLVVHKLIKDQHGPASISLRQGTSPVTASAQRLIDDISQHYADKLGKGYGRFEDDEANFPMSRLIRQYVLEESIDFAALSRQMMEHLRSRMEAEQLASGGYVLIARLRNNLSDSLLVAIITEAMGTAITESLEIVDSTHLDFANLRVAGRIDLLAWQNGAERYISFLKGRSDVAQYFKLFLGCNDVVIALKETQKLVRTLGHFADTQGLAQGARDELMQRAHGYLDELGESSTPISLEEAAGKIWPDAPERLRSALDDEAVELASGFVPDRRAIRPLVRFKANAPQWKLEFDRASLRSGAVVYDRRSDTVILSNVPEQLKRALMEE